MKNAILIAAVFIFSLVSLAAAQDVPPKLAGKFRKADLVELTTLDNSIRLDVRYATANNFVGRSVYPEARAFLQRPAAEALVRVHRNLKKQNLGLVVFDGYRPWTITKMFWAVTPEDKRKFVANPKNGSRHNRGAAVDLSLFDLTSGKLLEMPSEFDEFTERASPKYAGGTAEQTKNRELLRAAMEAEGFTVNDNEWWHFDYKDWKEYEIYDIAFTEVKPEIETFYRAKFEENKKMRRYFEEAGATGAILIYDLRANKFTTSDAARIEKAFVPASTSKFFNSLVFLETGALKDENEILEWDGVKRSVAVWNQNHDLRSAFKVSAVWFYVAASKRVGAEPLNHYYRLANYGNADTTGFGADFWNTGSLRITPREQINFLVRLHQNRLPFSARSVNIVKEISTVEKTDKYVLRAKTGWSDSFTPGVGWFVGYVTRGEDAFFFALEIDMKTAADAPKRQEITRRILRELKIID